MKLDIGLIGCGTIGSGVVEILTKNSELIRQRTGIEINLKKICDINKKKLESLNLESNKLTTDYKKVLNDNKIKIIVELIGGYEPARTIIIEAMKKGKHVVTANKAVISKYARELLSLAERYRVNLFFEAAVGGCIPIIRTLRQSYVSENIKAIYGILNGTTNFILTKMSEGLDYDEALKMAQAKGYAEANPEFDVSGADAAQKLRILASIVFNTAIEEDIFSWGITKISKNDLRYANELGYVVKLLAIAKKYEGYLELRVHPTMIPKNHELASVNYELNAIYIVGYHIDKVMLYGKGAGKKPTATVVVGDIIDAVKSLYNYSAPWRFFNKLPIKDMNTITSRYYLRYAVVDKPGVLAKITTILGNHNISIAGVWQKEENKEIVPVVMTTHKAIEENLINAVKEIDKLEVVKAKTVVIRIEDID